MRAISSKSVIPIMILNLKNNEILTNAFVGALLFNHNYLGKYLYLKNLNMQEITIPVKSRLAPFCDQYLSEPKKMHGLHTTVCAQIERRL